MKYTEENALELAIAKAKSYLIQGKCSKAIVCLTDNTEAVVIINPNFINALIKKDREGGLPDNMEIFEVFK